MKFRRQKRGNARPEMTVNGALTSSEWRYQEHERNYLETWELKFVNMNAMFSKH